MHKISRNMIIQKTGEELEPIICGICDNLFVEPMVSQCCGQAYCSQCISEWLSANDLCPDCPNCITSDQIKSSPQKISEGLEVKCIYHDNGCDTVLKLEQFKIHSIKCKFQNAIVCPKLPEIEVLFLLNYFD